MHKIALALALSGASLAATGAELRDYLYVALRSGQASGPVTGAIAENIMARTGSARTPIATVNVVGEFKEPGCKRMRVAISQEDVKTTDGRLVTAQIPPFEMNLCPNGSAPKETLDPVAVEQRREMLRKQMEILGKPAR